MSEGKGSGPVVLFVAAWGTNLLLDAASWVVPWLAPPHLLHAYMPEAVRGMVSPFVLAPVTSAVLAGIAVLLLSVVSPGSPRPVLRLTAWLSGFWLLSEGLMAWVWLDAPGSALVPALLVGAPRSLLVVLVLVRLRGGAPEAG